MPASRSLTELGPKFRVAICGAGIAGLVLAITIGKYDPSIPIDLYEAHDSIETAGVGVTLRKQTHEVLIELGLFDDFKHIFTYDPNSSHGPCVRRSDIREGGYVWYDQSTQSRGLSFMHRQHMVAALEKRLPASCTVHPGKRLVDYAESEQQDANSTSPLILKFADGATAATDVLIGADGIRSVIRKKMFEMASEDDNNDGTDLEQYIDATFTGITMYRWLIPAEELRKEDPENFSLQGMTSYHGKGKSCISYPIANRTIINVAATVIDPSLVDTRYEGHWTSEASPEQLVKMFDDFEPDVRALVKLCQKPSKWALHVVKPLPFCVRKRVALVGDACHAMTPHLGAGAGQAIEDAFVLGRIITHPLTTLGHIPKALRIYDEIRFPIARSVASLSLSTGLMHLFTAPGYYDGTRKHDNLDEKGISAYEREGMKALEQESLRVLDWMDTLGGALQVWSDAELKLRFERPALQVSSADMSYLFTPQRARL